MSKNFKELLGKVAVDQDAMKKLEALFDEKEVYNFFEEKGYTGNMQNFKEDVMGLLKDLVKEQNVSDDELKKVAGGASKNLNKAAAAALSLLSLAGTAMPSAGATGPNGVQAKVNQLAGQARDIASKNKNMIIPIGTGVAGAGTGALVAGLAAYFIPNYALGVKRNTENQVAIVQSAISQLAVVVQKASDDSEGKKDNQLSNIWNGAAKDLAKVMEKISKQYADLFGEVKAKGANKNVNDHINALKSYNFGTNGTTATNRTTLNDDFIKPFIDAMNVSQSIKDRINELGKDSTGWDVVVANINMAKEWGDLSGEGVNKLVEKECNQALKDFGTNFEEKQGKAQLKALTGANGIFKGILTKNNPRDIFNMLANMKGIFFVGEGGQFRNSTLHVDAVKNYIGFLNSVGDAGQADALVHLLNLSQLMNSEVNKDVQAVNEATNIINSANNKFNKTNGDLSDVDEAVLREMVKALDGAVVVGTAEITHLNNLRKSTTRGLGFENNANFNTVSNAAGALKNKLNAIIKFKAGVQNFGALQGNTKAALTDAIRNLNIQKFNGDGNLVDIDAADINNIMDAMFPGNNYDDGHGANVAFSAAADAAANNAVDAAAKAADANSLQARWTNAQGTLKNVINAKDNQTIDTEVGNVKNALNDLGSIQG